MTSNLDQVHGFGSKTVSERLATFSAIAFPDGIHTKRVAAELAASMAVDDAGMMLAHVRNIALRPDESQNFAMQHASKVVEHLAAMLAAFGIDLLEVLPTRACSRCAKESVECRSYGDELLCAPCIEIKVARDVLVDRELSPAIVERQSCGDIEHGGLAVLCECGLVRQNDRPHAFVNETVDLSERETLRELPAEEVPPVELLTSEAEQWRTLYLELRNEVMSFASGAVGERVLETARRHRKSHEQHRKAIGLLTDAERSLSAIHDFLNKEVSR